MTVIAIKGFRGAVPRYSARLLKPNQAQRARNCRITSGRLDPLRGPLAVTTTTLNAAIRSMFRYRHFQPTGAVDNWLTWAQDVDVVLSPLANDPRGTFYFTSESFEPRVSNYDLAIAGSLYPASWYALGVASPVTAPTVAPSGGSGPTENRSYAYTFVTQWGEESGPSPASASTSGNSDGTWDLSAMDTAPPNSGTVVTALANTPVAGQVRVELNSVFGLAEGDTVTFADVEGMTDLNGSRRILSVDVANKRVVVGLGTAQTYTSAGTWARNAVHNTVGMVKRIYRTAGTNPAFLFVAEIPASTTTYTDSVAPTALGEPLQTLVTLPPPKDLRCIKVLPNGCMVGLSKNELCLSEPYRFYSWPLGNRYSFSGRGVNVVPAGNSVIVLTDAAPILFTGSDPEAMSPRGMETYAPCVSKRGAVDAGGGALYPSFDGLYLATPAGVRKLTQDLYREDEWKALAPESFDAALFDGQYIAQYSAGPEVSALWVLDIAEPDSVLEVDDLVSALYRNPHDGDLYVAKGAVIYRWNSNDQQRYESDWHSMEYQLGRGATFNCAQVFADFSEIVPIDTTQQALNQELMASPTMGRGEILGHNFLDVEICGSQLVPLQAATQRRVQFTLLRRGKPFFTKNVTSSKPFRLPTGYREELLSVHMAISVPTYSVVVASSMEELKEFAP